MPRWILAVAALVVVYLGYTTVRDWPRGGRDAPPLVLGAEPAQEELETTIPVTIHRGGKTFFLLKTHSDDITAKVISAHAYDFVWTNDFFDVDLGLVWGDQVARLESEYEFYQDHRWLFWRSDHDVSDNERAYIGTHVGNVHTLPAEGQDRLGRALRSVRAGDLVHLAGYLVTIQDAGTNVLSRSSTSRSDTGGGACEVMWVDSIQIDETVYD